MRVSEPHPLLSSSVSALAMPQDVQQRVVMVEGEKRRRVALEHQ